MAKVTVIDTGSNAIRLAIAKPKNSGFEVLYKMRESLRLGGEVFGDGKISPALLDQLVAAFKKFKKISDEYGSDSIHAIGTSALRDAKNQKEVVKRIHEESGILIDVISGDRESELVFKAICFEKDIKKDNALLIDIGGGSVELVAVQQGEKLKGKSFQIGTVRLLNGLKDSPEDYHNPIKVLEAKLQESMAYIRDMKMKFDYCVGIGGNLERMGRVNAIMNGNDNSKQVNLQELIKMYDALIPLSVGKRMKMYELKADQADVIVPAIVLCIYFMQTAFIQDLHVPGIGIKDGLILEDLKIVR